MGLSRDITIRVATNHEQFSDLFLEFVSGFWVDNPEFHLDSLELDDIDDFNFKKFDHINLVKPILDLRESRGIDNYLAILIEEDNSSMLIRSTKKTTQYLGYNSHYELNFSPGAAKRIDGTKRYTDYGFYLNQIIPRLLAIGCYVCEITCHDFDC
ncbi:MAG: hypothetical protein EP332_13540 [Bacteroidetes bacterium]|nr:MAG: hypothetical protein EP332_13540 [Bacteroidota bacterium]